MQLLNGTRHRLLRADKQRSLPPSHRRSVACNCTGSASNETQHTSNAINKRQLLLGSAAVVGSTGAGLSSSRPATAAGEAEHGLLLTASCMQLSGSLHRGDCSYSVKVWCGAVRDSVTHL
jgi:hypothetical protein